MKRAAEKLLDAMDTHQDRYAAVMSLIIYAIGWARDHKEDMSEYERGALEDVAALIKKNDPKLPLEAEDWDPVKTITVLLDRSQFEGLRRDADNALKLGSKSGFLMMSNDPDAEAKMHQAMAQGNLGLSELPDPDLVIVSGVWTVGLPAPFAKLVEATVGTKEERA